MNVTCPECRSMFRVDPSKVPSAGVRARCSVCGGVITIGAGTSIDEEFDGEQATPVSVDAKAVEATVTPAAPSVATAQSAPDVPPSVEAPPPTNRQTPPIAQPAALRPPPFARVPLTPPASVPGIQRSSGGPSALPPIPPARSPSVGRPSGVGPLSAVRPTAGASMPLPVGPAAPAVRPEGGNAPSASRPAAPARTPINPFLANDPNAKARRLSRALVSDLVTYFPQRRDEGLRDGTLKDLFQEEIKKSYEEYVDQVGREFADSTTHFQDALNEILAAGRKVF